ncbi:polyprenyl diphosphate synthase [Dehalococcoidia bacterium]|nr:polyprenyl diphosphate synthase [Dehalococcoidia bacterium]MCL0070497.1 polyprenyl diphosphate synthase [Dehalococcoidia bacterium]
MDGNGRWAKNRGLTRLEGHRAGTENIRRIIRTFANHGVRYLTLFAFSTENWGRPRKEVEGLFRILSQVIDRETGKLHHEGVKIVHLGSLDGLAESLQAKVRESVELTKDNTRMTLGLAFNYGGRADILNAVRRIVQDGIAAEDIDEAAFARYLSTAGLPDPDLIIRTAGEMRLSNFLIWQAAYSEYYSTPTLWPDFDEKEVELALAAYSRRERRFGGLMPNKRRRGE